MAGISRLLGLHKECKVRNVLAGGLSIQNSFVHSKVIKKSLIMHCSGRELDLLAGEAISLKRCSRKEKEVAKNLPVLESWKKKMVMDLLTINHHNHVITKKRRNLE